MGHIALHVYPSTLQYESRIFKMAHTQINIGNYTKVYIVGLFKDGLVEHEILEAGIELHRIKLSWTRNIPGFKTLLFYLEFYHRVFWHYIKLNPHVVQCHSLSTLLLCVLIKWRTKCRLIYDAHELETESLGLVGWRKALAKCTERSLIRNADKVIVVSPSIEEWYKNKYKHANVACIRNLPYKLKTEAIDNNYFRKKFGISTNSPVFIYAGVLNTGRSITALLEVFALQPDKNIVFMGYGTLENDIKHYSNTYSNIHFHQAISYNQVSLYCAAADVGIVLSEYICLSYYYGYANKMFEYVQAGCAIIASNFKDMGAFVLTNKCGWACPPDIAAISTLLNTLTPENINRAKSMSCEIRHHYTWETEQALYIKTLTED